MPTSNESAKFLFKQGVFIFVLRSIKRCVINCSIIKILLYSLGGVTDFSVKGSRVTIVL